MPAAGVAKLLLSGIVSNKPYQHLAALGMAAGRDGVGVTV